MNVEVAIREHPRLRKGLTTIALGLPEIGGSEVVDMEFDALVRGLGEPSPLATDLLLIAGIVYVLDKATPRRLTDDAWTRVFSVEFPVSDPIHWRRVEDSVAQALSFLTGDEWNVSFTERRGTVFSPPRPIRTRPPRNQPTAVSLFSGGIDSLAGVLDALAASDAQLLLVGHHDAAGPSSDQARLHDSLNALPAYRGRTHRLSVRLRPLPPALARAGQRVAPAGREHTLRSRSFVFLALGICAVTASGAAVPLLVPENGFVAINMPLTPSRVGTCSTRTTHPYFLHLMREVTKDLGLPHQICNPFELTTKGEILRDSRDRPTVLGQVERSVSCAHASRRGRWVRRSARNCGYCVPCLTRRAALHFVDSDIGEHYGIDVCAGELDADAEVATDLRAVLDCVRNNHSPLDVADRIRLSGPLPPPLRGAYADMVSRGVQELRQLIAVKGTADLKARAGLA